MSHYLHGTCMFVRHDMSLVNQNKIAYVCTLCNQLCTHAHKYIHHRFSQRRTNLHCQSIQYEKCLWKPIMVFSQWFCENLQHVITYNTFEHHVPITRTTSCLHGFSQMQYYTLYQNIYQNYPIKHTHAECNSIDVIGRLYNFCPPAHA